jgi:hypothetical protein
LLFAFAFEAAKGWQLVVFGFLVFGVARGFVLAWGARFQR